MNTELAKYDVAALARISAVEDINTVINETLRRYDATRDVTLAWKSPKNGEKGEAQSLTKLVKAAQDGRGLPDATKEDKAFRKEQFRAVRAIFINERLNQLIAAAYDKLDYQTRFEGTAANGTATFKLVPPSVYAKDPVGKKSTEMMGDKKLANANKHLQGLGFSQAEIDAILAGGVVEAKATVTRLE